MISEQFFKGELIYSPYFFTILIIICMTYIISLVSYNFNIFYYILYTILALLHTPFIRQFGVNI